MLFPHVVMSSAMQRGAPVKPANIIAVTAVGVLVSLALITDSWFYLILVMAALGLVMFAVAHPRLALFLWLFVAPIANEYAKLPLPVGLPDLTFGRVVIGLVWTGMLLRMALKGRRLVPFGGVELAMLALVAIMVLDVMMRSGNPTSDALQNFDERIIPILLFLAARNLCVRPIDLKVTAGILVAVGCYLALHGGYQYLGLGSTNPTIEETEDLTVREGGMRVNESHLGGGRAVGPFLSAVEFGSVAAIILIAALYIAIYVNDGVGRFVTVAVVPLIATAVVFSATRSTWIGGYLGIVLMAVFDRRLRTRMLTALGITSVALLIAAVMLNPETSTIRERASSTEPIEGRLLMYEVGLKIAARSPLTGYGRGTPV